MWNHFAYITSILCISYRKKVQHTLFHTMQNQWYLLVLLLPPIIPHPPISLPYLISPSSSHPGSNKCDPCWHLKLIPLQWQNSNKFSICLGWKWTTSFAVNNNTNQKSEKKTQIKKAKNAIKKKTDFFPDLFCVSVSDVFVWMCFYATTHLWVRGCLYVCKCIHVTMHVCDCMSCNMCVLSL